MAETIVLDPVAVATGRTQLDITTWVAVAGPDWGDGAIAAYMADAVVGSSPVDYRIPNRIISIPLVLKTVSGTTFSTINTQLQQKVALFQREGGQIMRQFGSTPLYADIVNATLHLGGDWMQAYADTDIAATLQLECIPDWYGDEVTLDTLSGTTAVTSVLLQSAGTAVIGGDHPARVRFVVSDTSANDQHGLIWGVRARNYSGSATAALSYEAETLSPLNGAANAALSGASGGTVVQGTAFPAGVWVPMLYTNAVSGSAAMTHTGSYRAWARCYSGAATPQFQLQWGVGGLSVPTTNDPVRLPGTAAFYMLDLGPVSITPPPTGPNQWFGVVQAQVDTANDQAAIDRLFFQPLDEAAGKLRYVNIPPVSSIQAGPSDGTASADDSASGSISWAGTAGALSPGGTKATITLTGAQTSHYLKVTGFNFAVPTGATVKGVKAYIFDALTSLGGGSWATFAHLVKASTVQSGTGTLGSGGPNNGTYDAAVFGGPTDLWGATLSPSDVNNSGFGVAFQIIQNAGAGSNAFAVDEMQLIVYYTLAGGLTVAADAVIYASKTVELRTEGMFRSDSGGTIYAHVSQVTGDLPRLPPSGLETRPIQVFVKPTRGDLDQLADGGLDGLSVVPKVRPSYLFRP